MDLAPRLGWAQPRVGSTAGLEQPRVELGPDSWMQSEPLYSMAPAGSGSRCTTERIPVSAALIAEHLTRTHLADTRDPSAHPRGRWSPHHTPPQHPISPGAPVRCSGVQCSDMRWTFFSATIIPLHSDPWRLPPATLSRSLVVQDVSQAAEHSATWPLGGSCSAASWNPVDPRCIRRCAAQSTSRAKADRLLM